MSPKNHLRKHMNWRMSFVGSVYKKSALICQKLIAQKQLRKYQTFLVYRPLKNEPVLQNFIDFLLKEEKDVFIACMDEFAFEEISNGKRRKDFENIDVVISPGLAFDLNGYRLGRGGGWYDKLLGNFPVKLRIGVCFNEQIVPTIYPTENDHPYNIIITDKDPIILN